jgi:hypothetical protein
MNEFVRNQEDRTAKEGHAQISPQARRASHRATAAARSLVGVFRLVADGDDDEAEQAVEGGSGPELQPHPPACWRYLGNRARAASSPRCWLATTTSALTDGPVRRASPHDLSPRAMHSAWTRARSTLARTDAWTNSDSVSPSPSADSTSAQNAGLTPTDGMVAFLLQEANDPARRADAGAGWGGPGSCKPKEDGRLTGFGLDSRHFSRVYTPGWIGDHSKVSNPRTVDPSRTRPEILSWLSKPLPNRPLPR